MDGRDFWQPLAAFPAPTLEPNTGTGDSEPQTAAIVSVACLSMAGCAFIIASYILWPAIRTRTRLLLVFLSFADFMNSAGNAAGAACAQWCPQGAMATDTLNCISQSVITTFSSLCSFAWTVSIAVYLYWVFSSGDVGRSEKRIKWLHVVSWGLPLAVTLSALFCGALRNDDNFDSSGWCWIRRQPVLPRFPNTSSSYDSVSPNFEDRRSRTFWLIMAGKGWEILAYVLTLGFYVAIKYRVYTEIHHGRDRLLTTSGLATAQKVDRRLIFVPIVFILLRIWGTIRTMLDIADSGQHPESWFHSGTLRLLHGLGDNLQGFANFIIFCWMSPMIRSLMLPACCRRQKAASALRRSPSPYDARGLVSSAASQSSLAASACYDPSSRSSTPGQSGGMAASRLKSPVTSARSSPSVQSTPTRPSSSLHYGTLLSHTSP